MNPTTSPRAALYAFPIVFPLRRPSAWARDAGPRAPKSLANSPLPFAVHIPPMEAPVRDNKGTPTQEDCI